MKTRDVISFNPYFTGCFSFRKVTVTPRYRNSSFNPYFTGCFSFSLEIDYTRQSMNSSFNPYFTGCFSFSLVVRVVFFPSPLVSILILLDASLLGPSHTTARTYLDCFNPYFTGCFSFRDIVTPYPHCYWRFQSLFYWMLLF